MTEKDLELHIDREYLDEEIQKERVRIQESWASEMSIESAAQMLNDLSTSFDQRYYIDTIKQVTKKLKSGIKLWKNADYEMPMCTISAIMISWYNEIERTESLEPVVLLPWEMNFEITDDVVKKWVVIWSRTLLKELEKRLKEVSKMDKSLDTLSRRNVLEHMFINWIKSVAISYKDKEIIDASLKGFKSFEIKKDA